VIACDDAATGDEKSSRPTSFGGRSVLVSASTLEVVELLCARGAGPSCTYSFLRRVIRRISESVIASHRKLRRSDCALPLVRHGAYVNAIYQPHEYGRWHQQPFESYWNNVVELGDVL